MDIWCSHESREHAKQKYGYKYKCDLETRSHYTKRKYAVVTRVWVPCAALDVARHETAPRAAKCVCPLIMATQLININNNIANQPIIHSQFDYHSAITRQARRRRRRL